MAWYCWWKWEWINFFVSVWCFYLWNYVNWWLVIWLVVVGCVNCCGVDCDGCEIFVCFLLVFWMGFGIGYCWLVEFFYLGCECVRNYECFV